MLIVIILIYTATVMPYKLAFIENYKDDTWLFIDTVIDFLFFFDIIVNFNTPIVYDEKTIEYSRKIIFKQYFFSWFFVDLFASIPMDLIEYIWLPEAAINNDFVKVVRLPRLYRLMRIARLAKVAKMFRSSTNFQKIDEMLSHN